MKPIIFLILVLFLAIPLHASEWIKLQSSDGRELEARILSFDGQTVNIETRGRDRFEVPLFRLSEESAAKIEKWQLEVGVVRDAAQKLREEFLKSLQEEVVFKAEDLPIFMAYFGERPPRLMRGDVNERNLRNWEREMTRYERRKQRASIEYRSLMRSAFPGIRISETNPRLVLHEDYSMSADTLFRIIAFGGMDEDEYLFRWVSGHYKPYPEVRRKFVALRDRIHSQTIGKEQFAGYSKSVGEILKAMDLITRTGPDEDKLMELRSTISENLQNLGLDQHLAP